MKTPKSILIVLSLVLLTAGAARSMEQAGETSDTMKASCLIQVTSDPAIFPINYETIEALLYSSGVGGKAAREVLQIPPDEISDIFIIEILGSGGIMPPATSRRTTGAAPKSSTVRRPGEATAQFEARRRAEAAARARAVARSRTTPTTSQPAPATAAISTVGQTTLVRLSVELPDQAAPAAEEFSKKIVVLFEHSLLDSWDHHRNVLNDHLKTAEEEVKLTENELRSQQDILREISGSRALDRDEILLEIRRLRVTLESLEMEQVSEKFTVDATLKRIAEIERKTKTQIAEDTVTAELHQMIELNTQNLRHMKNLVETGSASIAQLADAEEKLARARIELARRREELSKSAGGNLIEALNMQLADSSIKTAQGKAHFTTYEQRLAEAEELLSKSSDYELISLRADIARQNLREVLVWRDRISRRMRMLRPPSVSVLGER